MELDETAADALDNADAVLVETPKDAEELAAARLVDDVTAWLELDAEVADTLAVTWTVVIIVVIIVVVIVVPVPD